MSRRTLKLNDRWDIYLNGSGNIDVATEAYATAQDVANAIRLFRNDAYFAWNEGVPHFALNLGVYPSRAAVRARYRAAALGISNVHDAHVEIFEIDDETRVMTGEVTIETITGTQARIEI